jgi:DNA-directed RNA polymerase subunit RPC12/RpoP
MRIRCSFCGKSVSTEVPDQTVFRAVAVCPECIEDKRILIPEPPPKPPATR